MVKILYKYRAYTAESLELILNREFYFSDPSDFNDPYDCKISISEAVEEVVEHAGSIAEQSVKAKLKKLMDLNDLYQKIEKDVSNCGVLSLSKANNEVLMWSHYADEHRGFCLGFNLSQKFKGYNEEHAIIGPSDVQYYKNNPFLDFFVEFAKAQEVPSWEEFWIPLLSLGLVAKSEAWRYENEVRVIRGMPGSVPFQPGELSEVVFGLRMPKQHKKTIRALLKTPEWKHVKYKKVIRKGKGFSLEVVDD